MNSLIGRGNAASWDWIEYFRFCLGSRPKKCSACGAVKNEMPLSERTYKCENCGFEADRDLNAAVNLASVAASWAETLNACKSGEVHAARQVLPYEAGTEHRLGVVLNG